MDQELLTVPQHMGSLSPGFSGVRFLCSVLLIIVCHLVLFILVIVLSVLCFTASDYPFGILDLRFLITPLLLSNSYFVYLSVNTSTMPLIISTYSFQNVVFGCRFVDTNFVEYIEYMYLIYISKTFLITWSCIEYTSYLD